MAVGVNKRVGHWSWFRTPELCEQGGGPGFSFPILFFPPSLISHRVAVDAKHHEEKKDNTTQNSGAA